MLKIIVAMDENHGIGFNNALPWSIKEDLKEFKRITLGHSILMGRKTLDSIGKALPGRTNFVMTKQASLPYENIVIVHDVLAFLKEKHKSDDLVFIIGGASLYRLALDYADELIISEVKGHYPCDTFFPSFDHNDFILAASLEFEQFTQKRYVRRPR
jgi:dihydrofolate reductase